ncbi:DivIVA domain-containing protein [Slackia heliotrinireducens]|jgi:DivIVA domain-containing protein|uniref:DivIVA domain-containing protein n=1 Tax=Slackia heliotrinireducens TaxID=84110 RepID=UPI003316489F
MAINSIEIQNKTFTVTRKGYDMDEVDVFLEHVGKEIDGLNAEIERLIDQVQSLRTQLNNEEEIDLDAAFAEPVIADEYVEEEEPEAPAPVLTEDEKDARIAELEAQVAAEKADASVIADALLTAQRSAQQVTDRANADARKIKADAESDAAGIINRANVEREKIEVAIADLEDTHQATCEAYAASLRAFVEDATQKIAEIDEELARAKNNTHVRSQGKAQQPMQGQVQPQPMYNAAATAYQQPVGQAPNGAVNAVRPTPYPQQSAPMEKDLSGYGDASDAFDLGDID